MIVRAVLDHPELIDNFDWFNDGNNTIAWLYMLNTPESLAIAKRMEVKLKEYEEIESLRFAGCKCRKPLLGSRPGGGPRCRLCNTEVKK